MVNFLAKNINKKPSMKAIIDYEIAKFLGKKEIYILVYYASSLKLLASVDGVKTNYLQIAKNVLELTKKYIVEQGVPLRNIEVEEINNWINPKINIGGLCH